MRRKLRIRRDERRLPQRGVDIRIETGKGREGGKEAIIRIEVID